MPGVLPHTVVKGDLLYTLRRNASFEESYYYGIEFHEADKDQLQPLIRKIEELAATTRGIVEPEAFKP